MDNVEVIEYGGHHAKASPGGLPTKEVTMAREHQRFQRSTARRSGPASVPAAESPPSPPVFAPPLPGTEDPPRAGAPSTFKAPPPVKSLRDEDALTVAEAASRAGVNRRTINRWLAQGSINRYTRQLNRTVISRTELDALIGARYQA